MVFSTERAPVKQPEHRGIVPSPKVSDTVVEPYSIFERSGETRKGTFCESMNSFEIDSPIFQFNSWRNGGTILATRNFQLICCTTALFPSNPMPLQTRTSIFPTFVFGSQIWILFELHNFVCVFLHQISRKLVRNSSLKGIGGSVGRECGWGVLYW